MRPRTSCSASRALRPPGHRRARARRERGIDAVDIEGDVERAIADELAHLDDDVGDAALADGVGADRGRAELRRELAVVGAAPRPAHAELYERAGRDEPLGDGVAQRRAVMPGIAPDLGRRSVVVRVEVHDRERAVRGRDRAHRRQRHGMIAAQHERHRAGGDDARHFRLHRGAHRRGVEWREDDVAAVARTHAREHVGAVHGVIALHQRADAAHVIGRQARARLIGRAAVVGDAEQHRVGAGVGVGRPDVDHRQAKERRLAVTQIMRRALLAHARTRYSIERTDERTRCARSSGLR